MEYNMDWKLRDYMLKNLNFGWRGSGDEYDTAHFTDLDSVTLEKLIELRFADPEDAQNDAPCIATILEFLKENPSFTAHGYVVTHERPDYRTSIEGVSGHSTNLDDMQNFMYAFRQADEFTCEVGTQYAWYD